jgi:hypothetical protein
MSEFLSNDRDADVFPGLPPFPSDIPTAPLLRLSLARLRTEQDESDALFKAAKELGFFYFDMRGDQLGEALLDESEKLFGVERELYSMDEEELMKHDYSHIEPWRSYFGYKGLGKGVIDTKGTRDRNQFYNVRVPLPLPSLVMFAIADGNATRPPKTTSSTSIPTLLPTPNPC